MVLGFFICIYSFLDNLCEKLFEWIKLKCLEVVILSFEITVKSRILPHLKKKIISLFSGSYEYESERMLTYLDEASSVDGHLLPVMFRFNPVSRFSKSSQSSMKLSLKLSQNVIKKNSQSCCVIFVL